MTLVASRLHTRRQRAHAGSAPAARVHCPEHSTRSTPWSLTRDARHTRIRLPGKQAGVQPAAARSYTHTQAGGTHVARRGRARSSHASADITQTLCDAGGAEALLVGRKPAADRAASRRARGALTRRSPRRRRRRGAACTRCSRRCPAASSRSRTCRWRRAQRTSRGRRTHAARR